MRQAPPGWTRGACFVLAAALVLAAAGCNLGRPPTSVIPTPLPAPAVILQGERLSVVFGPGDVRPSSLASLAADVEAVTHGDHQRRIFIQADEHVGYVRFMQVINALQNSGYLRIGLLNEEIDDPAR
jgi:biopolymer transport protein ExbD